MSLSSSSLLASPVVAGTVVFVARTRLLLLATILMTLLTMMQQSRPVHGWTTTPAVPSLPRRRTTTLGAVSSSQVALLDGAEWNSLQSVLLAETPKGQQKLPPSRTAKAGVLRVVTGTLLDDPNNGKRVVGVEAHDSNENKNGAVVSLSEEVQIYKDSMAILPGGVSDQTAMTTLVASLVGVHCALPCVEGVGGSSQDFFVSGKVVVLGGSDHAVFCAEGLASLGATVYLVSTKKPKVKNRKIQVLEPSIGEMELGFSSYIGEFDALLDTVGDETGGRIHVVARNDNDGDDPYNLGLGGGVLSELQRQNHCARYVSTLTASQRIVRDEGVLFGPRKAEEHLKAAATAAISSKPDVNYGRVMPPHGFSSTLQTLLDRGVTFSCKNKHNNVVARGWTLQDFWEFTTWPRDSSAAGDLRFGLPVRASGLFSDDEEENERMVLEPPLRSERVPPPDELRLEEEMEEDADSGAAAITQIVGVEGLQKDIVSPKRDCLLFLSAPYCKTCRYLTPRYNRMAREHHDNDDLMFAKADTSGAVGKLLGKVLEVDAVPTFVLFRRGKMFGTPLSVSRLPSTKLIRAVECLTSGMEWSSEILRDSDAGSR